MTAATVFLPPEVAARLRRRGAAIRWRTDHAADADRDRLWRSYVTGALWRERLDRRARRAVVAGLVDAERMFPFSALTGPGPVRCAVLVDIGQRCEQVAPCSVHDVDADPDADPVPGGVAVEPHEVELVDGVDRRTDIPLRPVAPDSDRPPVSAGDERLRDRVEQHFPVAH